MAQVTVKHWLEAPASVAKEQLQVEIDAASLNSLRDAIFMAAVKFERDFRSLLDQPPRNTETGADDQTNPRQKAPLCRSIRRHDEAAAAALQNAEMAAAKRSAASAAAVSDLQKSNPNLKVSM